MIGKIRILAVTALIVFLITSCKKDTSTPGTNLGNGNFILKGKVQTENGMPIEGALVKSGTLTFTTGSDGSFTLKNVPAENSNVNIEISKAGFFDSYRNVPLEGSSEYYTEATLIQKEIIGVINASSGGVVSSPSMDFQIDAPPNAFTNLDGSSYSGNVSVAGKYVKWTNFSILSTALPGGGLTAKNELGKTGTLEPFGLLATGFQSNSGARLVPSNRVIIRFVVPQNPLPGAPPSSTLIGYGMSRWIYQNSIKYYIDPAPGFGTEKIFLWETNPNGGYYLDAYFGDLIVIGKFWNRSSIKGKVICKNTQKPVEFSEVVLSSTTKGVYKTFTNKDGEYSFESVIANQSFTLTAKDKSIQVNSAPENKLLTAPMIEPDCEPSGPIYATWTYKGKTYKGNIRQVDDDSTDTSCASGIIDLGFMQTGSELNALNFYNFNTNLAPGESMELRLCGTAPFTCDCCTDVDVGTFGGIGFMFTGTLSGNITMGPNKTFTFNLQQTDCPTPDAEVITVTGSGTFP